MDDFPDPDFSFVMGPTPAALSQLGRDFSDLETKLDGHANAVRGQAKGKRVDDNTGRIHVGSQGVRNAATLATAGGVALNSAKGAAQRYMDTVMGGPVPAQYVDVVYQRDVVVPAAKQKMMNEATSASAREYQDETNKLATMRSIRQGAKEVLELQDKQIASRVAAAHSSVPKPAAAEPPRWTSGPDFGHGNEHSHMPPPVRDVGPPHDDPVHGKGGVPGSSNKAGTGDGDGEKEPAEQQHGLGQQPQPQMQPQQGQPQSGVAPQGTMPDAALSDPAHGTDSGRPHLGIPGVVGAVGGTAAPAATAAATTKAPATGTTKDGLVTNANVSGKVNLSAAAPGSGPVKQAGGVPRAAAGGGMPVMPPMPQLNGTQPTKPRTRIVSDVDPDLHGVNAVLDAIRGGTILRNDFDPTDPPGPPRS